MTRDEFLAALATSLRDLTAWLTSRRTPHAVIGGAAVALLGRPRITEDIDAVILAGDTDPGELLADAEAHGFVRRREDAAEFAAVTRVLQLRHRADGMPIDLSLGILPFEEEVIARAIRTGELGFEVPVATGEDLIIMKALAFRGKDVADIESLLDNDPKLDLRRVRYWTKMLAAGLDAPEIAERLERLLARREPEKRKRSPVGKKKPGPKRPRKI